MSILAVNAGSSSLKVALHDAQAREVLARVLVDWHGGGGQAQVVMHVGESEAQISSRSIDGCAAAMEAAGAALAGAGLELGRVTAVGHRVVHGGTAFSDSVRINATVLKKIDELSELAPLHNPGALQAIRSAQTAMGGAVHVAVFDTAYYAQLPALRYIYPLPYLWYEDWGIRRFGFHGINHAYCAGRAAEMLGRGAQDLRVVSCHLGNGASLTASNGGRAVATTMGYTPMEGVMMGARSGSVDPGILLHVMRQRGMSADELDRQLNRESGLLGVSGVSSDYRQVQAAAETGNARAVLALEMYADRVCGAVGSLATTMGGIDALVFTAGIGENATALRSRVCGSLAFLGILLDDKLNADATGDAEISAAGSPVHTLVIAAREELCIAREALRMASA